MMAEIQHTGSFQHHKSGSPNPLCLTAGVAPLELQSPHVGISCFSAAADAMCCGFLWSKEEFALAGLFGAVPLYTSSSKGEDMLIHGVDDLQTWNEMQQVC